MGDQSAEKDAGYRTKPNPGQPERCPSIDPHDELQCGRRIHDDDQCQFGGIGWKKGTPRYVSDHERAENAEAALARVRALLAYWTVSIPNDELRAALDGAS